MNQEPDPNLTKAEEQPPTMAQKWKAASARWAKEVNLAYISNPAARRDFRVQFRGKTSLAVFATVVLVFGGVTLFLFYQTMTAGLGPQAVQDALNSYCQVIMAILGISVALITPALAATAILAEKQRHSLDLVFSSPVKPLHYLFGKLLAGYRYVWILMLLSLPFTAMTVIMGGGSWLNILEAYFLLSLQGLIFTAIGVFFSSLVDKTLSALLYTYATVVGIFWVTFGLSMMSDPTLFERPAFMGGDAPLSVAFSPPLVEFAVGTFTRIGPLPIPNALLAVLITAGLVHFILQAAGGLLSKLSNRERAGLRLKSAGIFAAFGFAASIASLSIQNQGTSYPGPRLVSSTPEAFLWATLPLFVFIPFLGAYGGDGDRRQNHAGLFAFRDFLGKSVAGALPYLYFLLGSAGIAYLIPQLAYNPRFVGDHLTTIIYAFGFWTFAWSTARFASSFNMGIRASRTLQFLTFAGLLGAPLPIFVALTNTMTARNVDLKELWKFNPISPFIYDLGGGLTLFYAVVFAWIGLLMAAWSEKNYRKRRDQVVLAKMEEDAPLARMSTLSELSNDQELVQRLVQGN